MCAPKVNFSELDFQLQVQKSRIDNSRSTINKTQYVLIALQPISSSVIGTQINTQCTKKIQDKCIFYYIPEAFLILYRTGLFLIDSTVLTLCICASHCYCFGIQWRWKQIRCINQGHNKKSISNADRVACPSRCKLY